MACRIVMLGGPGAGKGTQAQRLAEKHGLAHVSTGDIFRAQTENTTEMGQKIQRYLSAGRLLPDALVCEVVAERLNEADCRNGYILDGFPRSMPQAEEFDRLLSARNESLDIVIDLEVSDDEMVARLAARRTCPECGRIYNLKFNPPEQDEQCDEPDCAGTALVQRDDDREDTIRKRLKIYHETTKPILAYYDAKGLRRPVPGEQLSPDEIAAKINEIMSTAGVS